MMTMGVTTTITVMMMMKKVMKMMMTMMEERLIVTGDSRCFKSVASPWGMGDVTVGRCGSRRSKTSGSTPVLHVGFFAPVVLATW